MSRVTSRPLVPSSEQGDLWKRWERVRSGVGASKIATFPQRSEAGLSSGGYCCC